MPLQIILADNQVIFRAGTARVLAAQDDLHVVAQCADLQRLKEAITAHPQTVVIFPSSIALDLHDLMENIERAGSKSIIIQEHGMTLADAIIKRASGVVLRSVAGPQLVNTLHRVAAGERSVPADGSKRKTMQDSVGARVLERLTPKEIQIVALVAEGCKNKDIASRLATKEQVIKNYLRGIYDKTGVSDRLELALFTVHHPTLAEAAERAIATLTQPA